MVYGHFDVHVKDTADRFAVEFLNIAESWPNTSESFIEFDSDIRPAETDFQSDTVSLKHFTWFCIFNDNSTDYFKTLFHE